MSLRQHAPQLRLCKHCTTLLVGCGDRRHGVELGSQASGVGIRGPGGSASAWYLAPSSGIECNTRKSFALKISSKQGRPPRPAGCHSNLRIQADESVRTTGSWKILSDS